MSATIESRGTHAGLDWECVTSDMGHRCGYVRIPVGHPLFGLGFSSPAPRVTRADLDDEAVGKRGIVSVVIAACGDESTVRLDALFDVHGSLTFGDWRHDKGDWWLGFDCAHLGDAKDPDLMSERFRSITRECSLSNDGVVRSREYVEAECRSLAEQIVARYPLVTKPESQP